MWCWPSAGRAGAVRTGECLWPCSCGCSRRGDSVRTPFGVLTFNDNNKVPAPRPRVPWAVQRDATEIRPLPVHTGHRPRCRGAGHCGDGARHKRAALPGTVAEQKAAGQRQMRSPSPRARGSPGAAVPQLVEGGQVPESGASPALGAGRARLSPGATAVLAVCRSQPSPPPARQSRGGGLPDTVGALWGRPGGHAFWQAVRADPSRRPWPGGLVLTGCWALALSRGQPDWVPGVPRTPSGWMV